MTHSILVLNTKFFCGSAHVFALSSFPYWKTTVLKNLTL